MAVPLPPEPPAALPLPETTVADPGTVTRAEAIAALSPCLQRLQVDPTAAGGCRIRVSDQGAGLSDEAMDRLNHGQDGLLPQPGHGVGFGLLFVQRVARRHGGRLSACRGDGGRGAAFELVFEPGEGAVGGARHPAEEERRDGDHVYIGTRNERRQGKSASDSATGQ